ncbi:MAG: hypothetical protein VX589_11380 [Myxococcota bacterium]|nr:hypothetical protein [Myxococcota bacterium]
MGMNRGFIVLCMVAGAFGCGDVAEQASIDVLEGDPQGVINVSLLDGSPSAVGILSWLNDESTDVWSLDVEANLDRRAARFIIHHRNGPDGTYGTWDDNPFDTIEEVDEVKWVGPKTMARLAEFATAMGWVPVRGDLLGVYDRVAFSVVDSEAVISLVNRESLTYLDDLLHRRAAQNIVAERPIRSIKQLARIAYVGTDALLTLKYAALPKLSNE